MDASTIGFLVVVILASGLIAYFADWLGRKLGKKRLTIGKLRPRHTAAIGTTLSGMIISALTIVLVMAFSSDVRDWILKGNAAIQEAKLTLAQLEKLQGEYTTLKKEADGQVQLVSQMETQSKTLKDDVARLTSSIKPLQAQRDELVKKNEQATRQVAQAERNVATAQRNLEAVRSRERASKKSLKDAETQLRVAMNDRKDAYERLRTIDADLDAATKKLAKTQGDLTAKQAQITALDAQITNLSKTVAETQEDLVEATNKLDDAKSDLDLTLTKLEWAEKDLARLTAGLEGNLLNTRWRPLVLPGGEELARIQLPPNQTPEQVRAALLNVEQKSREAAVERGVKPKGSTSPASIRDQMVDGKVVSAEDQRQAVIKAAAGLKEESVIISTSFWNVFAQEDVPLLVVAYKNPLVYRQGEVVAETRIDGTRDDGVILKQLNEFIVDKVKHKALADKMIPAVGREQTLGSVTFEDMLGLARNIKDFNRRVRLVAVTRQDTRAADPLRLDFQIR